ncbi:MAG: diaminopimelate epimerase [Gammaproteobacteria bacterium CG11_big_fil_rev_8_21_14_0_20_46_22]|nr:MAG: diaminopimelate epimerase [Gammaproteobacteria bacterium CG12_big_fil_rev_8_21_14_0_65_46_12]PIR12054.1 MAG: diaminopimelate epimerase [Gammaproteobacteria bacterium CG11_big_fil_rev_8_21_14_0_20_46_22]
MKLTFSKMQALGNDFVVVNVCEAGNVLTPENVQFIADRHFGVGCDQLLALAPASVPKADFDYWIFNADGGRVYQCGNGARALAHYVFDRGLVQGDTVSFYTGRDRLTLHNEGDGQYRLVLPSANECVIPYHVNIGEQTLEGSFIDIGNPHYVMFVEDIHAKGHVEIARLLQAHQQFPHSVNVGFACVRNRTQIDLRVFERGAGETLACGSGAIACALAAFEQNLVDERVDIQQAGGRLSVDCSQSQDALYLTGPASFVFEGTLSL